MFRPHYFLDVAFYYLHAHTCTGKRANEASTASLTSTDRSRDWRRGDAWCLDRWGGVHCLRTSTQRALGAGRLHLPVRICLGCVGQLIDWVWLLVESPIQSYLIKLAGQECNMHFERAWEKKGEILEISLSISRSPSGPLSLPFASLFQLACWRSPAVAWEWGRESNFQGEGILEGVWE